ncbi:hypothetical protein TL18_03365 [Methanobrevibacter sp. YE315]|uniref:hypothetical protein n=1 Tax=Methanobrevibacter sp. YE315 TaxID=1609968 RepID=UPI000764E7EC|nr:hypothetical protein [Methanobrevibacter sp. YE315]AMD17142.1 hypothetical protein TL18_03365 [Methanobrevibacter sp. YE315]
MILAKGKLKATKLIRYIRFIHKRMSAGKFKLKAISGSATTVILAINCIINCAVAATINVSLVCEKLIIIPLIKIIFLQHIIFLGF